MKGGAHPSPFSSLSFSNLKKVPIYCLVDRVFQSPHGEAEAEPRTHAIRQIHDRCPTDCATQPGFLSVSHFRIFASFDSLYRAVSWYYTLTKVIYRYKQKKLGYFQTVFTVTKVQPCILVSFVFKLSLRLVGGWADWNISKFPEEDCVAGKFPEEDLHLDSLYTEIVILKQN